MTKVALVRLSAMGDVVQCLGAARALVEARPDLEIHFVTQSTFAPLLENLGFASVIPHDRGGGLRGWRRTRRALSALALDAVIDLQGNWKSAVACRLAGATRRIGMAAPHRREPSSALLLRPTADLEASGGSRHPAAIADGLLRKLEPTLVSADPRLLPNAVELEVAEDSVRSAGIDPNQPFSVFVVSDPRDIRAWWMSAMIRQATAESCPVLWLRGPAERTVSLPMAATQLTHGQSEPRALIGLGAVIARSGGRVLGPDLGPVHVLSAAGAEVHVFFGPQDPERTAPPGAQALIREGGPSCVPCRSRRCRHVDGPICMDFGLDESLSIENAPR